MTGITIHPDNSVTVRDRGRGIPVDEVADQGMSKLDNAAQSLYVDGTVKISDLAAFRGSLNEDRIAYLKVAAAAPEAKKTFEADVTRLDGDVAHRPCYRATAGSAAHGPGGQRETARMALRRTDNDARADR